MSYSYEKHLQLNNNDFNLFNDYISDLDLF